MTFQRFIKRNGLHNGDYNIAPEKHRIRVNLDSPGLMPEEDFIRHIHPYHVTQIKEYEAAFKMMAGDLRRLEIDTVDESAICNIISDRIKIPKDIVAAVLKEFMAY